ncbi:hypothetical protein SY88_09150 [Clostridiales bacterium PH28_bin88]|nr:hypothetical protein SY88_09150 [Clostridiales bacterium PH28_bin88]
MLKGEIVLQQDVMEEKYRQKFPRSRKLYEAAKTMIPDGIAHDIRYSEPFPVYITHAAGAHKWDVDGNEYIDYFGGHGALLLGHQHPQVVEAVVEQARKGTHFGASHPLEVEWARLVTSMVPGADLVRFTSSGTEATLLALRLARAFTGRERIVKLDAHFHGWHDTVVPGGDSARSPGVPRGTLDCVKLCPPNDAEALEAALAGEPTAAVILEPSGASFGRVPVRPGFPAEARELATRFGAVLIFDEVITGFRLAPGGAQEYYGVKADLVTMGKIVSGGLPGGAVAGRDDIMGLLEMKRGLGKVSHPGTFNGNPLSAAAGVAALKIIATGEPISAANAKNADLIEGFNRVIAAKGIDWCAYGHASIFQIAMNCDCPKKSDCDRTVCTYDWLKLRNHDRPKELKLRRNMLLNGVDFVGSGGWVSAVHSDKDIEDTIAAFQLSLDQM